MLDWKPIGTAPRNRRSVLLYSPLCGVLCGHRIKGGWAGDGTSHAIRPTHWMPLPAAPAKV